MGTDGATPRGKSGHQDTFDQLSCASGRCITSHRTWCWGALVLSRRHPPPPHLLACRPSVSTLGRRAGGWGSPPQVHLPWRAHRAGWNQQAPRRGPPALHCQARPQAWWGWWMRAPPAAAVSESSTRGPQLWHQPCPHPDRLPWCRLGGRRPRLRPRHATWRGQRLLGSCAGHETPKQAPWPRQWQWGQGQDRGH